MKIIALLSLLICGPAFAYDPAGPPPKRTFQWTVHHLMYAKIPLVDFQAVSVIDALGTAAPIEHPKEYRVEFKISDDEAVRDKRINLKAKDITKMELIAAIAEQANLDMLIQPGVVVFVPRSRIAERAGAGQPATKPADKHPVKDQPPTPTLKDAPR